MSIHVFIDESVRRQTYLLCAVSVEARNIQRCRRVMTTLNHANQRRLHFVKERPDRRRRLLAEMTRLPISADFFSATGHQVVARELCLRDALTSLADKPVSRLVFELADGEYQRDRRTAKLMIPKVPWLGEASLEHLRAFEEPMLWLPDALAWAHGAGGEWRDHIAGLVNGS